MRFYDVPQKRLLVLKRRYVSRRMDNAFCILYVYLSTELYYYKVYKYILYTCERAQVFRVPTTHPIVSAPSPS